jgi:MFS transporter, PPP family, 3-phenylpropionic acid transporter
MGFLAGFAAIFAVLTLASFVFTPIGSLIDAYALKGLSQRGLPYGPVRLWGSVAFVAANLGAGLALNVMGASHLIWLISGALALMTFAALQLLPLKLDEMQAPKAAAPQRFSWSSPVMVMVAIGASLVQASHAVYYGFSTLDWIGKGVGSTAIGTLWGLGVVAEIILFAISGRWLSSIHPFVWLLAGAAGGVIRWTAMAFEPAGLLLAALQCLHGLTFGATHLGAVQFFAKSAPHRSSASAQGYYATFQAIISGSVTGVSGLLYANFDSQAYFAMAILAALGGVLIYLANRQRAPEVLAAF